MCCSFFQLHIINNCENSQNYSTFRWMVGMLLPIIVGRYTNQISLDTGTILGVRAILIYCAWVLRTICLVINKNLIVCKNVNTWWRPIHVCIKVEKPCLVVSSRCMYMHCTFNKWRFFTYVPSSKHLGGKNRSTFLYVCHAKPLWFFDFDCDSSCLSLSPLSCLI